MDREARGSTTGGGVRLASYDKAEKVKSISSFILVAGSDCLRSHPLSCGSVSRVNGTPNYRAVLDFGSVCNVATPPLSNETFLPTANDSLELSIAVRVENHPHLLTASATNWVGAGLTYGNGLLWLGAQALTAVNTYKTPYAANAIVSLAALLLIKR